jgi:predicted alpha-1,6-mannanase (GH76 family)
MNWKSRCWCLLLGVWLLCSGSMLSSGAAESNDVASPSYGQMAALAIRGLQSWYDKQTGLYTTTGWWNSANAITTLADYSRMSGSHEFDSVFANTFSAAQEKSRGFLNRYYDDEGWWALAWIDAYDLTGDQRYLAMAESIFADMAGGWDNTCAGGIWWSKDRTYKNAIANELFLSVAAHLGSRAKSLRDRKQYLKWATREWRWFSHSGMINPDHLVNDGLDAKCVNNQKTTWTYNQGVIVGALVEFSRAGHTSRLLHTATVIAAAALSAPALVDAHGVLHEPCEPNCGGDGSQFKGIFVRNLRSLDEAAFLPPYHKFIFTNADSIWSGTRAPDYHLGLIWSAPFGEVNASTQSSAADVLVSAMEAEKVKTSR